MHSRRKTVKITDEKLEALLREYAAARLLRTNEQWRDAVPAHTDEAARRSFRQMELWIAAGAVLAPAETARRAAAGGASAKTAAGLGTALKVAAAGAGAAALICAGAYAAPAARGLADRLLLQWNPFPALSEPAVPVRADRVPGDYVIPDPGGGYELRQEASGESMAVKWYVSPRRQVMVQIAYQLPEEPPTAAFEESVDLGPLTGALYDVNGDRQLLLRDGSVYILIKMFNADRQDILDYAAALVADNS